MLFYRPPVLDKSQFCLEKISVFDSLVVVVLSPFSVLWNQTSPIVGAFFIWLLGVLGSLFCSCHCWTNSRAVGIFTSPVSDKLPGIRHLSLTRVSRTPKESVSFSHQCRPNSQGVGVFLSPVSAELPMSRHLSLRRSRHLALTSVGRTPKESALSLTTVSRTPKESASFPHQCRTNFQAVGSFLCLVRGSFDVVVVLPSICARSMQTPPAEILL